MSKRIFLVTGGAGFVGANLCRRLAGMGEEVHLLVKSTSNMFRLDDIRDKLHLHISDLRNAQDVENAIRDIRPTIIYHLATRGAYSTQSDGDNILLVNVFGTWNLLTACQKHGYELFVNTGSSSEYGRKMFAMRETDVLEPDSYYAVAKCAQSLLARHCSMVSDLPIVSLRLFSVYGPYEEPSRLIPRLMMAALFGEHIKMVNPNTARDFVYVDDVVDVYQDIEHLKKFRGEILNVGTGMQSSLANLVDDTESVLGHKIPSLHWGEMPSRTWDSDVWVADITRLRRLTGSYPRTTLKEGLRRCLDWFKNNSEHYREGTFSLPC